MPVNAPAPATQPAEFRARLKAMKLTAREFSAMTGVHPNTISYWGRGVPAIS